MAYTIRERSCTPEGSGTYVHVETHCPKGAVRNTKLSESDRSRNRSRVYIGNEKALIERYRKSKGL